MVGVVLVVLSILLPVPFGEAEAAAVDDEGGLAVEMSVEVTETFEAVLVRPFSSFEDLPPTALVDRGDGVWGGFVVFPTAEDWSVVFEGIDADGSSVRSETASLTELGVDPVVVDPPPSEPVGTPVSAATWWLWIGIGLAIVALGFLAWWTFGGNGDEGPEAT